MNSGPTVLLAGHISLDIIPDMCDLEAGFDTFRPGRLILVDGMSFATGGAVLNTGLAMHRLGLGVRLLVKVGKDPYGQLLQSLVQNTLTTVSSSNLCSSELSLIEDALSETSSTLVLNPKNSDRMFICCTGTNQTFVAKDVADTYFQGIELFHFGYPPMLQNIYLDGGESLSLLFEKAHQRGIVTSLDMCMPDVEGQSGQVDWRSFLEHVLPHVDIFMPSVQEILFMMNFARYEQVQSGDAVSLLTEQELIDLSQTLVDMGAKVVGIKLGEHGLYVQTGKVSCLKKSNCIKPPWWPIFPDSKWDYRQLYSPCFEVEVAGTTGAGDSTIAGFLSAMMNGLDIERCVTHAVGVGAFSVEQMDATSAIPTSEAVEQRIFKDWKSRASATALNHWPQVGRLRRGPKDAHEI